MRSIRESMDSIVEGAINFRDLGGYRCSTSGRVRTGRVYRSAMTHHITPAGLTALRDRVGLRTVLDFRNADELKNDGAAPFEEHGIAYHNVPVGGETVLTPGERSDWMKRIARGDVDWVEVYGKIASRGAEAYRTLFEIVASEDRIPMVFHCTGGRDRTGVGAALLLSCLGVSDQEVADDYALTGGLLRPHTDRFRRHIEMFGMSDEQWVRLIETKSEAMQRYLAEVRRTHGSIDAYVRSIGVSEAILGAVRKNLLDVS